MLALIAGAGALPAALSAHLPQAPLVCALAGFEPDALDVDVIFRLETLGGLLRDLKQRGVRDVCLAGAIRRPRIDPAAIDADTRPLVPVLQKALGAGDDGALRAVIAIFEDAGFTVRAAHDIAPDLLPPPGCPTRNQPTTGDRTDAARGAAIVQALAVADVGQSCAVLAGQALAIEGVFGTDWMLHSLVARPDGAGGILFKAPKPGQDVRADLPLIGPDTVQSVADAGLTGIVVEAGGVMILDLAQVIAACDDNGIFLWLREPDG